MPGVVDAGKASRMIVVTAQDAGQLRQMICKDAERSPAHNCDKPQGGNRNTGACVERIQQHHEADNRHGGHRE